MSKAAMPKTEDWDHYWSLDQTQQFTKISWSKKRIIEILLPYIKSDGKALDAGCGSGFFSKYFCDQGMTTYSLDYSDEALKIAQEATGGQTTIIKADLLNEKISHSISERFQIIFTDGLFEHFSFNEQDMIFNNFKSVLDSDGVIVTFVPNRFSPWELVRPFYMPGIKEDPFTLKQLVDLNIRNKMAVLAKGGINTFPFRLSPDKLMGSAFGMLLYTISRMDSAK